MPARSSTTSGNRAERLGKKQLKAQQISARFGGLKCALRGNRITPAGRAVLNLEGAITV